MLDTLVLRPNQESALAELPQRVAAGRRRIVITSPTGGGKTYIALKLCQLFRRVVIYSHRKLLTEQMMDNIDSCELDYGIQAAGYEATGFENIQVAQIQTVARRFESGQMDLHDADLVVIDEAHAETGARAELLIREHAARGAVVVGLTATPLELNGLYEDLIVAGLMSELRDCGALVPAHTYAPDEPDMRAFKSQTKAILEIDGKAEEVMLPVIFGRAKEHALILNPTLRPAILFAPSVATSQWFAERFWSCNIPAAHIDGERIWINGEAMEANRENRRVLREASESGRVKIVCNRFVLRTGVDWPFLYHGILACTFGALGPYIQAGGRLLRAAPGLDHVIVQDHGGNYWRHDSLNADRQWSLEDTEATIRGKHYEAFRTKAEAEPIVCPRCMRARSGRTVACPNCGLVVKTRTRRVIQLSGQLKEVRGDIFRERRVVNTPALHQAWMQCVCRCRNAGMNFNQARGLFQRENGYLSPGPDYPMMPHDEGEWFRAISEVYPKKAKP